MSARPFVHLHCHSHYSLLDGAGSIGNVGRAKDHGMTALAITDHGNLHGALEFYRKCKSADLNPIIGYEAYIAPGSRHSKDSGSMKESNYHLTLLAQNRTGFQNLVKMTSRAYLEGFYFKPRIDKELLEAHNEGIVCLSGCLSSEFNRTLLKGGDDGRAMREAEEIAGWFHNLFGDRYFVEIMNNGMEIQRIATQGAIDLAQRMGLPLVTTCDTHYVDADDAEAQDVMLCINTGKFKSDTSRMKMEGNQYYLKSPEEMYSAFPGHEDAVARTQEIADSVDIDLELGQRHFPVYDLPPEKTTADYLRELCEQGLKERYAGDEEMLPGGELAPVVVERLNRELGVINELGFANYFLIVWDFVRHARETGVPATARGSGVGALVRYALYLSHVCPIRYDLLFERFLDPSRTEAPDIDIDFCKERRGQIMRYVKDKYGEDNVAQIGTFGTLAARAAIKDVGRVLGLPLTRVNQVTDMVPEELHITLDAALEKSAELKQAYDNDPEIHELLDLARRIEGLARNVGTHAAAVVIADRPLTDYVPLCRVSGKNDVITQWSMGDVEAAGLLKMDFLGLRNLTILSKAVELIEQTTGETVDPHRFPLDDAETFALLCRGETKGIFQLESGGIRDLLQKMKPDHFHDIIATAALYRPGPLEGGMVEEYVEVKHGRREAQYKHPVLKDVLEETNGVMVYQEQVMRILNKLGGIELAKAYTCIKAISKKKEALIGQNQEAFLSGAVERGLARKEAVELWEMILKFAGYGFNKSHSTAYALIAYQTAYLKAHHPLEFMAALLSGDIPGRNFKRKDALVEHLEDCQRMGIEVVPPNVNSSGVDFTVAGGRIHFALSAIKGCGGGAAEAIVRAREAEGPFKDIFDFCERVDPQSCNRSTLETLIKAGAFDSLGANRRQLAEAVDLALQAGASALADRKSGQKSLFGDSGDEESPQAEVVPLPNVPDWPERERLLYEKEVLGYYLTSHPLAEYEEKLSTYCTHTTTNLAGLGDRKPVVLGGMLSAIKLVDARKAREGAPSKYANFDLEDVDGAIRCIMWPEQFAQQGHLVESDAILVVCGKLDRRGGDEANLIVDELIPLDQLDTRFVRGVVVRVDEQAGTRQQVADLKRLLAAHPGRAELQLQLNLADGRLVQLKSESVRIELNSQLRRQLDELLGPGHFSLSIERPQVAAAGNGNGHGRGGYRSRN